MTWYGTTRHSFVSRNLAESASLDEVSAAVGHSSPLVTRRYYNHFVRKSFSDGLRKGLGMQGAKAPVTPLRKRAKKSSAPYSAEFSARVDIV